MKEAKKTWTKESIRAGINMSDLGVERGILAIFKRQTEDEKRSEITRHSNNRGFNSSDARRGTYYAKWILSGRRLNGSHLTRARKMLQKYCGQLALIANGE